MAATIAWGRSLRALRSRNYRLFFAGQSVSLIGTWMTRLAMSWIVYQLTDSAFLLGLTSFVGQIPAFFVAPIAGVWLDRWNRHRVLVITQVLAMIQSLALAALAFTHYINLWWIIALALMQGLINAFDMPARQAFVIEMIEERADLGNAIALELFHGQRREAGGSRCCRHAHRHRRRRRLFPAGRDQLHRRDLVAAGDEGPRRRSRVRRRKAPCRS